VNRAVTALMSRGAPRVLGALGRVVGVHGVRGRDILQCDWCGAYRVYAFIREL
jgi:hypothetical protein